MQSTQLPPHESPSHTRSGGSSASVVVALLIGAVVGFAVGKATGGMSAITGNRAPTAAANAARPAPRAPAAVDPTVYKVELGNAPINGPADALVTIVEFSDYQCPFCG